MDMDVDKSEDELELEKLVFGDADGIRQRLKNGKEIEHTFQKTDLEHLENDQVPVTLANKPDFSYSSSIQGSRLSKLNKSRKMKTNQLIRVQRGMTAMTKLSPFPWQTRHKIASFARPKTKTQ